jgi:serine/threonine protein kinase/tetratricopeptide (TPR) repeat protein
MIGQTISHYRIVEKLGEGGMGVVYKAEDTKLRRTVALKFPPVDKLASEEERTRFVREAQASAALNHPNICTVYEIGEASGQPFIAMELVEGESLKDKVRTRPLPLEEALDIATQAAKGLQAAHAKGVVHRDIKSANLMVTTEGQVKVMDFGLAQVGDRSHLTKTGTTLGTVAYMSPEQALAQPLDRRTDIWSLGVVLYEMLTGSLPFQGDVEGAVAYAVINTEPEPPTARRSGLPVELDHILDKALAKKTDERYQHIEDMLVDLRTLQRSLQTGEAAAITRRRRSARKKTTTLRAAALVAVVMVLAAVGLYVIRPPPSEPTAGIAPRQEASVVVLPLDNLSDDPEQEYFSDGMTEALISDLGKIAALKVISRHSAMRYKDSPTPLPQIARELGVNHVVVGSVTQVEGQVRIAAQLVDAATDRQLWSDSFVRERRDILALQAQVARTIAQQIRVQLSPQEQARLARSQTVNPDAYEAYLQGRFHAAKLSPADLDTALKYHELALEKDPNFAPAYAGIAFVWGGRQQMGTVPPKEAGPRARAAIARALELDSASEEVQYALGAFKAWVEWEWQEADAAFRRALDINPNYAEAHSAYSHLLHIVRRPEEAMAEIERAIELDPHNPMFQAFYCINFNLVGRYDDAMAQCRDALRTAPNNFVAHGGLLAALHQKGMYEQALEHARARLAIYGGPEVQAALDRGYAVAGYRGAMALVAETLVAQSRRAYVSPIDIAEYYAYAGNKDQTLDWIEKGLDAREPNTPYIHIVPLFASLRNEPRFGEVLRRMNIPPE